MAIVEKNVGTGETLVTFADAMDDASNGTFQPSDDVVYILLAGKGNGETADDFAWDATTVTASTTPASFTIRPDTPSGTFGAGNVSLQLTGTLAASFRHPSFTVQDLRLTSSGERGQVIFPSVGGGAANRTVYRNCLFTGPMTSNNLSPILLNHSAGGALVIVNCTFADIQFFSVSQSPTSALQYQLIRSTRTSSSDDTRVYNCIFDNIAGSTEHNNATIRGVSKTQAAVTVFLYNCIFGDFSVAAGGSGSTTCIDTSTSPHEIVTTGTTDGTGSADLQNLDTSVEFEDTANNNYNLKLGAKSIGTNNPPGTDLSADADYPFDDDASGVTRETPWDLGSLAYGATPDAPVIVISNNKAVYGT